MHTHTHTYIYLCKYIDLLHIHVGIGFLKSDVNSDFFNKNTYFVFYLMQKNKTF